MSHSMPNYVCAAKTPVLLFGHTKTAMEWAELFGLHWKTLKTRRRRGVAWEDAFRPSRYSPRRAEKAAME
ncbi:hypothetical protein [Pseudomonas sp. M47T1]|uniref:hypothetical protein n=1 Tax=Pseudomonas sp. M47T1 TaxID=1179778 RepID=UPI0012F7399D|nr:hypothetical protein [Pseudomonas sp. M47T1]